MVAIGAAVGGAWHLYNEAAVRGVTPDGLRVEIPMAEPATTMRSIGVGYERDALLATKLHIPRPRAGLVARPRLVERLDEGMARELVLVCTPAGFGKTTLLADWVRGGQRPVAWLSLDEGDNDPVRFWRHVAAALGTVRPGVAERVVPLLGSLQSASLDAVVATLVNKLAGMAEGVVLVVDDYHLIEAQSVHASLEYLLEHLPSSLRLVLASRADPPLPLARLRARGQLTELRAADLRFTPTEATAVLRAAVGPDVPEVALAALGERTEGWVAGLQLAALSLRGQLDIDAFVQTFSGSHRYVLDYLTEEVLERQPPQQRQFLLETSILDRVCGPLADAVTGRSDSQAILEQVERANLFLIPLDAVRGWWRHHHLFTDLLRARLQQEQPARMLELHRAAAAWYERHELVDEAMRHALAAGDTTRAARLIEQHFEALLGRNEDATLAGGWSCCRRMRCAPGHGCAWPRPSGHSSAAEWRRWSGYSTRQSKRSRMLTTDRTSRRSVGTRAWWRTSRRRSPACTPPWPNSAVTPSRPSRSPARPWPSWSRANGCWSPSLAGTWPWPSGYAASQRRLSAPSCPAAPASPLGARPAS
jgi:hypothetical protein